VAINLAMERRRSKRADSADLDKSLAQDAASPLQQMVRAEELAQILDGLSELPELSRECFVLRLIEDESYDEIAKKVGKTAHQARGLCHAAVRALRERLVVKSTK
jgi:RNA polymerase sigma factor (sigma-70 family)